MNDDDALALAGEARAIAGQAMEQARALQAAGAADSAAMRALDRIYEDAGAVHALVAGMEQINPTVFAKKRRLYQRLVAAKRQHAARSATSAQKRGGAPKPVPNDQLPPHFRPTAASARRLDVPQRDVSEPPPGFEPQPAVRTTSAAEALARATPKKTVTAVPGRGLPLPKGASRVAGRTDPA